MKYLYILSRLTVGRWRTACPWGWGNENENCHSDAALPKSDLQIPKALQFWICRFFHAVGITVIATTIRTWSWRTICTWSWRTAPDAMVKPPPSFVFSTFLSGRRSGGTWEASAVRSIFICHSNASAMAPTTLRPITFKKGFQRSTKCDAHGVPFLPKSVMLTLWKMKSIAYCIVLFLPNAAPATIFPKSVMLTFWNMKSNYCLLQAIVFSSTAPATFPSKSVLLTLWILKAIAFLRSHGFFSKYCSCHSAIGAEFLVAYLLLRRRRQKIFTAETRPPKYCSCHSAIGAEFLVTYLLSKYCAAGARKFLQVTYLLSKYCTAGARKFLQQKPVLKDICSPARRQPINVNMLPQILVTEDAFLPFLQSPVLLTLWRSSWWKPNATQWDKKNCLK